MTERDVPERRAPDLIRQAPQWKENVVTASASTRPGGILLASVRRAARAVRQRAGRFRMALLVFVLLLPLLLTVFLGDGG